MSEQSNSAGSTRNQWQAHIRILEKSGLSRAEYCRQHNLSYHALTYWLRKLSASSSHQPLLVPVPLRQTAILSDRQPSGVKILLGGRVAIELTEQFSPAALHRALTVLEGR